MLKKDNKGNMELPNVSDYESFKLEFSEIDNETIQIDVHGTGALNYFEKLDEELELEINININNALSDYSEITEHSAQDIGYSLTIEPSKKLNRNFNTIQTGVTISIVFKKPVPGASLFSLQPTIELITSMILGEIFILQE